MLLRRHRLGVLHHFQPEPAQGHLLARRAKYTQAARAEVRQDLRARPVAAPLGHAGSGQGLLPQSCQHRFGIVARCQHHERTRLGTRNLRQRRGQRQAEVGPVQVQEVGELVLHMHAHQQCVPRIDAAMHERIVQFARDAVAIGDKAEWTVIADQTEGEKAVVTAVEETADKAERKRDN